MPKKKFTDTKLAVRVDGVRFAKLCSYYPGVSSSVLIRALIEKQLKELEQSSSPPLQIPVEEIEGLVSSVIDTK